MQILLQTPGELKTPLTLLDQHFAAAACAKLADLEEMAKEIDSKATSHEIKQLAQQQAALAQSVNGMAEWLAVRPDPDGNKGPPSLTNSST